MNLIYTLILNLDSSNHLGTSVIFIFHFYRKGDGVFLLRRKLLIVNSLSLIRTVNINGAKLQYTDFPGGVVVKNPPANAGDMGSSPGPGRPHVPQTN